LLLVVERVRQEHAELARRGEQAQALGRLSRLFITTLLLSRILSDLH
jgi:hypothetical protein